MFGAFRPTNPLSGGLLWKIPWRLSPTQKLRHRRRLRRVDNVVSILDSALQRAAQISGSQKPRQSSTPSPPPVAPSQPIHTPGTPKTTQVSASELSATAEGQRLLNAEANSTLSEQRHGRGPRQGDVLHGSLPTERVTMTGDEARRAGTIKLIERWKAEMPTEGEMLAKDKYSMFDRKAKGYRKGVHKLPKWTRVSQRLNPPGF